MPGYTWCIYSRYRRTHSKFLDPSHCALKGVVFVCLHSFNTTKTCTVAHAICADHSCCSHLITLNGAWACSEGHQTRSHQPCAIIHTGKTLRRQVEGRLQQRIWTALNKTLLPSSARVQQFTMVWCLTANACGMKSQKSPENSGSC